MEDIVLRLCIGLPPFLMAIVCHEAAHAWVATRFGDPTAKQMGRLSLNPSVHLDLFGTVIFPLISILMGGVMFGWAKPVPVDTRYFKDVRKSIFWVSFAGPGANIILGILSAFFLAFLVTKVPADFFLHKVLMDMFRQSVIINIILAVFNLIPFPPLDGSKMVSTFLSYHQQIKYEELQRFSLLFFIVLMYTGALSVVINPALNMGNGLIRIFYQLLV